MNQRMHLWMCCRCLEIQILVVFHYTYSKQEILAGVFKNILDRMTHLHTLCYNHVVLSWLLRWVMTIIFPVTKVKADVVQRSQKWNQITHERPSRLNMLHCSAFHKPPEVNPCFLLQLWGSAFCRVLDSVQPPTHDLQTLEPSPTKQAERKLWNITSDRGFPS